MNLKSLSAKIIAAVFLLVAVAFIADMIIGSRISGSVNKETGRLVDEMGDALHDRDGQVKDLLSTKLALEEERLELKHGMAELTERTKTEREANLLRGMHKGIATSITTLVQQAMLTGDAAAAVDAIDTLLENPAIYSIRLWRIDGREAFRDNVTIDAVNKIMGDETFERRDEEEPVRIEGERAKVHAQVVETHNQDLKLDTMFEGDEGPIPVTFSYVLMENTEECQGCHGETTDPRGVIEVALSRAELLRLQDETKIQLDKLTASQQEDAEVLKKSNAQAIGKMDADSTRLAQRIEEGRANVADLQDSASTWSALAKVGFFVVAVVVLLLVLRGLLTRPLTGMSESMHRLAGGDLGVDIPGNGRADEIGEMAGAVEVFKKNAIELKQVMAKQEAESRRNERKLQSEMLALTNALDEEVKAAIGIVVQQSEAMHEAAVEMGDAVVKVEQRADAASGAAGNASHAVDAVAAGAEQLSSSIREISEQVTKSTSIAHKAVEEAEATNARIQGLAQAANKIGEVVELITDIAEQTNLLALNATIEAARAGDAGKGFAVVASEVKNLANQTGKATEEIAAQIGGIQSATQEAVEAIGGIGGIISEINEITTTIAAAVEEQSAATANISENARHAASGTQDATTNIGDVSSTAEESAQHSREVQESAEEVRGRVQSMQATLDTIMHAVSDEEERRRAMLHTVNVAAKIQMDGQEFACLVQDLSIGGAAIIDRVLDGDRGSAFEIDFPGIGHMSGGIVALTGQSSHVRFDLNDDQASQLEEFVSGRIRR